MVILSYKASLMIDIINLVGSRATCNPPPTNTDRDYLILLHGRVTMADFSRQMKIDGFKLDKGGTYMGPESVPNREASPFYSFSKGDLNLIVTRSYIFRNKFWKATALAKQFNLMKKVDRITLFQYVLYGS